MVVSIAETAQLDIYADSSSCSVSRGWFHLWYLLGELYQAKMVDFRTELLRSTKRSTVTVSAMADGHAQLPFSKQLRLFLSDVPCDIAVEGGDDFMQDNFNNESHDDYSTNIAKALGNAMGQLKTIAPAAVYREAGAPTRLRGHATPCSS